MNRLFSANKSGIICLCDRKRPGISTKSSASLFFCLLLLHITSSEIFEGRTSFRKPLFNEGRVYRRSIRSVASSTNCVWPDVDALFILDSTLNISPFDHAQERNFLEKVLATMNIGSNRSRVAIAQFTPKERQEFALGATTDANSVLQVVQRLQLTPCNTVATPALCQPTSSVNSIASHALRDGNRKWIPDVLVVVSSAKWKIPELPNDAEESKNRKRATTAYEEDLASRRFMHCWLTMNLDNLSTSIMLSAVDFSALDQLVQPLCVSVSDFVVGGSAPGGLRPGGGGGGGRLPSFVPPEPAPARVDPGIEEMTTKSYAAAAVLAANPWPRMQYTTQYPDSSYVNTAGPSWDYFSPLAWTIVIVLLLTFIIILLAVGLALYEYRRENERLRAKIVEMERQLRTQNEYFTGKIQKQMESELASRQKFEEEMKKVEETHLRNTEKLEKKLERQIEKEKESTMMAMTRPAQVVQPQAAPPPQPIIIPAYFGTNARGRPQGVPFTAAPGTVTLIGPNGTQVSSSIHPPAQSGVQHPPGTQIPLSDTQISHKPQPSAYPDQADPRDGGSGKGYEKRSSLEMLNEATRRFSKRMDSALPKPKRPPVVHSPIETRLMGMTTPARTLPKPPSKSPVKSRTNSIRSSEAPSSAMTQSTEKSSKALLPKHPQPFSA